MFASSVAADIAIESLCPLSLARDAAMANQLDLTSVHARAICDEIGIRLGCVLRPDRNELPLRLRDLVLRLAQMEHEAPSLVPSLEHMAMPRMDAA